MKSSDKYTLRKNDKLIESNTTINPNELNNEDRNNVEHLTSFTKICFASAALPYQMYFCAMNVFTTVFLLEAANLHPRKLSIVLFVSRIMDALTDPIYGYLIEKTRVTKYGRYKPW
jgi:Na+/melibiose symporter-like transporter